ncbi:MAG: hypothetical protein BWY49_00531 [Candidatus Omnitrophica bacterium ADurb.Bin314]|nr:MAG: hypothetical protein BWY49_00531 [Candidatus Omnitrophica bacterium ADurb.Bin314]
MGGKLADKHPFASVKDRLLPFRLNLQAVVDAVLQAVGPLIDRGIVGPAARHLEHIRTPGRRERLLFPGRVHDPVDRLQGLFPADPLRNIPDRFPAVRSVRVDAHAVIPVRIVDIRELIRGIVIIAVVNALSVRNRAGDRDPARSQRDTRFFGIGLIPDKGGHLERLLKTHPFTAGQGQFNPLPARSGRIIEHGLAQAVIPVAVRGACPGVRGRIIAGPGHIEDLPVGDRRGQGRMPAVGRRELAKLQTDLIFAHAAVLRENRLMPVDPRHGVDPVFYGQAVAHVRIGAVRPLIGDIVIRSAKRHIKNVPGFKRVKRLIPLLRIRDPLLVRGRILLDMTANLVLADPLRHTPGRLRRKLCIRVFAITETDGNSAFDRNAVALVRIGHIRELVDGIHEILRVLAVGHGPGDHDAAGIKRHAGFLTIRHIPDPGKLRAGLRKRHTLAL